MNRGQGIVTFGIETKDKPIMEFQTANKAYEVASKLGFRTFVQIEGVTDGVYEPFSPETTNYDAPEGSGMCAYFTAISAQVRPLERQRASSARLLPWRAKADDGLAAASCAGLLRL